jgi:hypothetical protein
MPVAMEMAAHEKGWSIESNYYIFHTHSSLEMYCNVHKQLFILETMAL